MDWPILVNAYDGLELRHPADWQSEIEPGVATILHGPGAKLTVLAQPLGQVTAREYIMYSNRSVLGQQAGLILEETRHGRLLGFEAWLLRWRRAPLAEDDLCHYLEYDLVHGSTVYTFMLKTDALRAEAGEAALRSILRSFVPSAPQAATGPGSGNAGEAVSAGRMAVTIGTPGAAVHIPADRTMWGIMTPHKLGTLDLLPRIRDLEADLGHEFGLASTYICFSTEPRPEELQRVYSDGRLMMLAIQPWRVGQGNEALLLAMLRGEYDDWLRGWARAVAAANGPVFVRFGNEFNGDWSTWCAWFYGKDPDIFRLAWRHVVAVFRSEGADNAVHVFNPHDRSFPSFRWNHPLLYYPGDDVVDWIGLTGYNNGVAHPGDRWRGFSEIHDPLYAEYLAWWPEMPLMITEFASNENGGDKAAWIQECVEQLYARYPRIKIAVWFDQIDGLWEYHLRSSEASLAAFREGLQRPEYQIWPSCGPTPGRSP